MHSREDEFTVVTHGRIGFLLGEDVFEARTGRAGPEAEGSVAHVL
jgi:hypothetical protein